MVEMTSARQPGTEQGPSPGVAEPGMVLTVRYDETGRTETFKLGGYGACDTDRKLYPLRSPLGRAIVGARAGEQRRVVTPDGPAVPVTLLHALADARTPARRPQSRFRSGARNRLRRQAHLGTSGSPRNPSSRKDGRR
ncbi:hypothetical protein BST27_24230 [Mycobacterium intermedium]|uniref:Transcription elongation factor GreA/GreB C-terminal domain-containing protein n=2 Tax=Mycobacterium intermedium TaxID=28445 RepID=A0A1T3WB70_MYCIE|nr:GreA/GreB family elongation factor [Mycobacterium intermedium]OPE51612.1 hypothetical protein BV508_05730 [Mycobacterium intermedium]ORA96797.1 hypothetical protein BST27_24230 [Mycobacterium intermedium]